MHAFKTVPKDKRAKGRDARRHYSQPYRKAPTGAMLPGKTEEQKPTIEEDPHQARRQEADRSPMPLAGSKMLKPTN